MTKCAISGKPVMVGHVVSQEALKELHINLVLSRNYIERDLEKARENKAYWDESYSKSPKEGKADSQAANLLLNSTYSQGKVDALEKVLELALWELFAEVDGGT